MPEPYRGIRVHARRRRTDEPWTVGEHMDFEDRLDNRLGGMERQLARLTWMLAVGTGVVATLAFVLGLLAPYLNKIGGS